MAIYTRKGDKGLTSLYSEKGGDWSVAKNSERVELLGGVDEVVSFLGIIKASTKSPKLKKVLSRVQEELLLINSIVAGANLSFTKEKLTELERLIDQKEAKLPVLKNFIIPGESLVSAQLHYARSLVRKVERKAYFLRDDERFSLILAYINRLSDFLFMLAREYNWKLRIKDEIWIGRKR